MNFGQKDANALVNECEKLSRNAQQRYFEIWRDAINAFEGLTTVDDVFSTQVTVNHLLSAIETVTPRDVKALLGSRPYIPIQAKNPEFNDWAKVIEKIADDMLDEAEFFPKFVDAFRICRATGTSFIETFWDIEEENFIQRIPKYDQMTGSLIGLEQFESTTVKERLGFRDLGPWEVFVDPMGNRMSDKRWVIIKQLTNKEYVQDLMDIGAYKKISSDKLKSASPYESEWARELERDKSCLGKDASDVGVLCRFMSKDRYIDTWNYSVVLRDQENPHKNMRKKVYPVVVFRDVTHIGPDRFWGKGMWEVIRHQAHLGDDVLTEFFDQVKMGTYRWMMYNPDVVSPEELDAVYGNRIPVRGGRFDSAVKEFAPIPPSQELFQLYGIAKGFIDSQQQLSYLQSGAAAPRKETAFTTGALKEAGDEKLEFGVRYFEGTAMTELAYLVTKFLDANMSTADIAEKIGWDKALELESLDPEAMPGGYTFKFNGSDRVMQRTQKMEALSGWWNLVGNDPALADRTIPLRKFTEYLEMFSETERDAMFPSAQVDPQQQAIQEQMRQNAMGASGETPSGVQSVGQSTSITNPRYLSETASNVEMQKTA